jgi:replicative DNA helicase
MTEPRRPFGAKKYSEILKEGLEYIENRRQGKIKSLKTPWLGFNNASINGLEWGSMLTIGARPGSGKTLIVSQLLKEAYKNNQGQDFNILEFQFEMGGKQSAARAFAAETALDYNLVLSTNKQLDQFSYNHMVNFTKDVEDMERMGIIRMQINNPLNSQDMEKAIHYWYNELGSKPMVVTIDHSWLIKKSPNEKEKIATLYNTVEMLMKLKNELPIIVIMITQLNRSIEEPARKTPGSIGNYPTSSDIFGGDALMQGSDMVMVLSRPAINDINIYGPKQYIVKNDDIFVHLLKVRNASNDVNILFMKAEFNRQRMIEVGEPVAANPSGASGFRRRSQRNQPEPNDIDVSGI